MNLWEGGVDTGTAMAVSEGEISISELVTFDAIKLSDSAAYSSDISLTDARMILQQMVEIIDLSGTALQAADINNDGNISLTDARAVLKHMVEISTMDTFDLVDSNGALVTSLSPLSTGDAPIYSLVMNGDVNESGSFSTDYITTIDIV